MASFRATDKRTVTIDKANNEFIGTKCINPLKTDDLPIGSMFNREKLTPLPEITGFVPHKIVNGEFVRL